MNIVFLFDHSGNMARPWATAGAQCWCYDILNSNTFEAVGAGSIAYRKANLRDMQIEIEIEALAPKFIFGFPPCTDLAVSGACRFEEKGFANPRFQAQAMELVYITRNLGTAFSCPWAFENPVSKISTYYREPDFKFNPWEFGGYLPEDDIHPTWPKYIPARDAYPKLTCIWAGGGFKFPKKSPVPYLLGMAPQIALLGGDSERTKMIRNETPRGFALAVFEANKSILTKGTLP